MQALSSHVSLRGVALGLWVFLFPLLMALWLWPVKTQFLRWGCCLVLFGVIIGSLFFASRHRVLLLSLTGGFVLVGGFLLFPGRPAFSGLRQEDAEALLRYEGVPYVWGGESSFGMDCSGLARKGFQDALFQKGIRTFNPSLVREAIDLWWNDSTAREMANGYGGRTRGVTKCASLLALEPDLLEPGDMAVTSSGIHIMIYLGDNRWIGADPGEGRVTVFSVPETSSGWFSTPMNIVRWLGCSSP